MDVFVFSFLIAVFWWVYIHITSEPEMIMHWFYMRLDRWTINRKKINKLLSCEYCLAGFTSMVLFPFLIEYNFLWHLFFVSLSIFFVKIINVLIYGKEED